MKPSYRTLSVISCLVVSQFAWAVPAGYTEDKIIFKDDFDTPSVSLTGKDVDGTQLNWNRIEYQSNNVGSGWRTYQSIDEDLVQYNDDGTVTLWGKKGTYSNEKNSTATEIVYEDNTYACGGIFTNKTFSFQYGYVEVKAKFDSVQGVWPAIWMMPVSNDGYGWPYNGEIDIMEHLNYDSKVYQTLHFWRDSGKGDNNPGVNGGTGATIDGTNDWHAYGMEWQPDSISFYIDGEKTGTLYAADYIYWPYARENNEFYLKIDQQIGGSWVEGSGEGGIDGDKLASDGAALTLDYVNVYSAQDAVTANTWKNGSSATWTDGVVLADGSTWSGSDEMIFDGTTGEVAVGSVKTVSLATRNKASVSLSGGTITNADGQTLRVFADAGSSIMISSVLICRSGLNIGGAVGSSVTVAGDISCSGDININSVATVELSGQVGGTGTININAGEVTFSGTIATTGRTININGGQVVISGASSQSYWDAGGNINIAAGSSLAIRSGGALFCRSSESGNTAGTVTVSGTLSLENFGWGNGESSLGCLGYTPSNFVLENGARLEITETGTSGRGITMNGWGAVYTIAVANGKTFTWNRDLDAYANVLTAGTEAGCALLLEVGAGATMNMGKEINSGLALTKSGAGQLMYNGSISLSANRNLHVKEGNMTVTGDVSNTNIVLHGGSLAVNGETTLNASATVEISSGASFVAGAEGITVTVAEGASSAVLSATAANTKVSLASSDLTVRNATVTIDQDTEVTVNASIANSAVQNIGSGSVTLSSATSEARLINQSATGAATGILTDRYASSSQSEYKAIRAMTGDILLYNKSAGIGVTELEISGNSVVSVYSGSAANEADEVSALVSGGTLTANGGRLNANLTLRDSLVKISGENGLTLGSTLTIGEGNSLDWSIVTSSLTKDGDMYTLFSGVDALTIVGTGYMNYTGALTLEDNVLATNVFCGYTGNHPEAYILTYSGGENAVLSITYRVVPEPTTGLFVAVSFAAVALRRRRKK